MEFFKQENHRNLRYMNWLKKQKCVVSRKKAQVAHHIRLGTNGGQGLKPSDYFCIPLLNIYHTGGKLAVHNIGEETFLKRFNLSKEKIFIHYLSLYLKSEYKLSLKPEQEDNQTIFINKLIKLIEKNRTDEDREESKLEKIKLPSVTENEYYQKAKEAKKIKDKELRKQLKEKQQDDERLKTPKASETEYYQKAKEAKKVKDKELRQQLKEQQKLKAQSLNTKPTYQKELYEKAKEAQKDFDRQRKEQLKAKQSEYRKAQYRKLKELKK